MFCVAQVHQKDINKKKKKQYFGGWGEFGVPVSVFRKGKHWTSEIAKQVKALVANLSLIPWGPTWWKE